MRPHNEVFREPAIARRATYLNVADHRLLDDWAKPLWKMWANGDHVGVYLVGSALERADYRDVDVRIILGDDSFRALSTAIDVARLNLMLTLWGQKVTGLPLDVQVQSMSIANAIEGTRRNAIGLMRGAAAGTPEETP